jgi:hypothetical protein
MTTIFRQDIIYPRSRTHRQIRIHFVTDIALYWKDAEEGDDRTDAQMNYIIPASSCPGSSAELVRNTCPLISSQEIIRSLKICVLWRLRNQLGTTHSG